MSKISLQPNASGAGTFTVVAPDSNTNRTLNLPDESGVLFSDGSGVPGSAVTGQLASSNMPAGSVIQVVSTTKTDTFSASVGARPSFSSVVSGLTATITPSLTSSKILVIVNVNGSSTADSGRFAFKLSRNGADVFVGDANGVRSRLTSGNVVGNFSRNWGVANVTSSFLDSPSTVSSLTYGIKLFNSNGSSETLYVNRPQDYPDNDLYSTNASSITVMEIAG